MDEKHSPDGSPADGSPFPGSNTASPATAPPRMLVADLPSTPARFELTSLIKTLPEPGPRPSAPWSTSNAAPPATSPGTIPQSAAPEASPAALANPPTQPIAPVAGPATTPPFIPTPAFTPFAAASAPPPPAPLPPRSLAATATAPARSLAARALSAAVTAARFAVIAFAAWLVTVMVLIAAFRYIDPPQSMLMLTKRLSGETLTHEWVSLAGISTSLRRAVVTSEDSKFCRHWGFDLGEIRAAMNRTEGLGRGASTITQQVAKNLFLWPGKSYIRKALEIPLTLAIEALWSKKRILEIYLNFAEWGPGIFGAEAAAQYHYDKPASKLTEREAALLAVSLPNPIARDAGDPNAALARRASTLQTRMRVQGISYCALTPKTS